MLAGRRGWLVKIPFDWGRCIYEKCRYGRYSLCHPAILVKKHTLWLFNVAIENGPFIDDFPSKTSIYGEFSMAMLNNQMVFQFLLTSFWHCPICCIFWLLQSSSLWPMLLYSKAMTFSNIPWTSAERPRIRRKFAPILVQFPRIKNWTINFQSLKIYWNHELFLKRSKKNLLKCPLSNPFRGYLVVS